MGGPFTLLSSHSFKRASALVRITKPNRCLSLVSDFRLRRRCNLFTPSAGRSYASLWCPFAESPSETLEKVTSPIKYRSPTLSSSMIARRRS